MKFILFTLVVGGALVYLAIAEGYGPAPLVDDVADVAPETQTQVAAAPQSTPIEPVSPEPALAEPALAEPALAGPALADEPAASDSVFTPPPETPVAAPAPPVEEALSPDVAARRAAVMAPDNGSPAPAVAPVPLADERDQRARLLDLSDDMALFAAEIMAE